MGFVKHKREKVGFKWLSDVTWDEIREAEELREVARKYADLIKDVNTRLWKVYNEAYEEASEETGVREEALFRVATYFNLMLSDFGYSEIAKSKVLDSHRVFDLLVRQLEEHSKDHGSSEAVGEMGRVMNPPTYELQRRGIYIIYNLNDRLRRVVGNAIKKCKNLLGNNKEFSSCVAKELREGYGHVKWWFERLDEEDLKKDLKTIYKKLSIIWSE